MELKPENFIGVPSASLNLLQELLSNKWPRIFYWGSFWFSEPAVGARFKRPRAFFNRNRRSHQKPEAFCGSSFPDPGCDVIVLNNQVADVMRLCIPETLAAPSLGGDFHVIPSERSFKVSAVTHGREHIVCVQCTDVKV